jgi:hypothetical protein
VRLHALYRPDRYTFEIDFVGTGTREIVVTHCAPVEKWRHSFDDGLINRSKPPDVRTPR